MAKKLANINKQENNLTENKIKISIIVPAYNLEKYIHACLESLTTQTLKEIEIIVINDASTDGTLARIQEKSNSDNRIKVISYDINKSSSQARKDGVLQSSGKYIMFIDGDDTLELTACENLYKLMETEDVDILQFGTNVISSGATEGQIKWFENFAMPYAFKIIDENLLEHCFVKRNFGFTIWNKIYKSELCKTAFLSVKDGYYPKAQDLYAFFIIAYFAKSYLGVEDKYYNYSYGTGITGSSTFTKETFGRHCSQTTILLEIINFLISNNSLMQFKNAVKGVFETFFADNLSTLSRIRKQVLDFDAFDVFASYWVNGDLLISSLNLLNNDKDNYALYEIIMEIIMKIYKNVPNEIRVQLLLHIDDLSKITVLKNIYPSQSKEDLFFQLFISYTIKARVPNTIPIVLATDDNYAPYLGVTLQSIIDNSSNEENYEIFVFNTALNTNFVNSLEMMSQKNIRISCINVSSIIESQNLYSKAHYSVAMYFRYLIAELFFFYPKVLYLDCDLVLVDQVSKLFNIDIGDQILGVIHNPIHRGMGNYLRDNLKFDRTKYFNSGVLLINTERFISCNVKRRCLDIIKQKRDLACPDQDALNIVCKNRVYEIDQRWNFQWHHAISINPTNNNKLLDEEKENYYNAMHSFSLIHYTSNIKPWNTPSAQFSNIFWNYARKTNFYEEIIYKNTIVNIPATQAPSTNKKPLNKGLNEEAFEITNKVIEGNNRELAIEIVKKLNGYLKHKSLIRKFFIAIKYEGLHNAFQKVKNYLRKSRK